MADTGDSGDVQVHEATYGFFTKLMLYGTIISAALGAFVVLMIAS